MQVGMMKLVPWLRLHLVAKLVKSFGRLGDSAESLDGFRYTKA